MESGNEVEEFMLSSMKINGCLGCWNGGTNPESPCTQNDDMDEIYPKYKEADVIVLASPLYYWHISGFLKNAFDRLFAIAECDYYKNPKKESVLIMLLKGQVLKSPNSGMIESKDISDGRVLERFYAAMSPNREILKVKRNLKKHMSLENQSNRRNQ